MRAHLDQNSVPGIVVFTFSLVSTSLPSPTHIKTLLALLPLHHLLITTITWSLKWLGIGVTRYIHVSIASRFTVRAERVIEYTVFDLS